VITLRAALVLFVIAFGSWAAFPFLGRALPVVLPLGGLIAFAAGWLIAGAALAGRRRILGAAFAAILYLVAGGAWVVAWNAGLRFRDDIFVPAMVDPIPIAASVLIWPWFAVMWQVLDRFD
jgi:hypothetical protein